MSALLRWLKFNLVGAMGMAVQLAALALFNRWMHGHYLWASAAAIELTLLHNFLWHRRFTWRDRRDAGPWPPPLIRFHLSNGLVSLAGNLALMRLLVQGAHFPLLVANGVAILCCSVANFWLGNWWAFAATETSQRTRVSKTVRSTIAHSLLLAWLFLSFSAAPTHAQTPIVTPKADSPHEYGTDCAYENFFVGPALSTGSGATKATLTTGVTIGQYFARPLAKGLRASPQFEFGVVGPLPQGHPLDGFVSFGAMFANKLPRRHIYPFITGGYTRFFATGNAVNLGLGMDFGKDEYKRVVRIELRDYYLFTGPRQHVFGLRLGFGRFLSD